MGKGRNGHCFSGYYGKRQAERELIKTAKLESLGVLAAGIAHDFNNTLAAIISNLQLATIQYDKQMDISPTPGPDRRDLL